MAEWDPFGSPGPGDSAGDMIAEAEVAAGYGTPEEQKRKRQRKKKRKKRKADEQAAADAAAAALLMQEVPFYQDPRAIGGGLVLAAIVGGIWYSKKAKK